MLTLASRCNKICKIKGLATRLCGVKPVICYLSLRSSVLAVSYLSLCSSMLAGAALSFSCSSSFLVLKRQNLSSQSEPAVSVSWFRVSVATPLTAPLWAETEGTLSSVKRRDTVWGRLRARARDHTFLAIAVATTVQTGLQVEDVDAAA